MATITKKQRDAYARKLREISRNFDRLERDTLQQSIRLLRQVRNSIAGQLTDTASDFDQFRIAEQQAAIDDILAQYEAQARAMTNGAVRQSITLGERSAVEPLQALGIDGAFFQASDAQVQVLSQFSADLISDLSTGMLGKINRQIQLNALAGNSQLQAMQNITRIMFGRDRVGKLTDPTKGVAYEAERILRTETNRAYNLAAFSQQEKLADVVPGMRKQWVATADARTRDEHLRLHGEVQPTGKQFTNGLMFPGDPSGPPQEIINCRCRVVSVVPEVEDTTLSSQADVDAEIAAREKEKARKARARFTVADEIALIEKGSADVFAAIRPPSSRAPRGLGQEYKLRRSIVSKIETQMRYRELAQKQLDQYRGQTSHRLRWRIDVAKERVLQLDKGITAALDIASETITDDWVFKKELVDGIFGHVSALRVS